MNKLDSNTLKILLSSIYNKLPKKELEKLSKEIELIFFKTRVKKKNTKTYGMKKIFF